MSSAIGRTAATRISFPTSLGCRTFCPPYSAASAPSLGNKQLASVRSVERDCAELVPRLSFPPYPTDLDEIDAFSVAVQRALSALFVVNSSRRVSDYTHHSSTNRREGRASGVIVEKLRGKRSLFVLCDDSAHRLAVHAAQALFVLCGAVGSVLPSSRLEY